MALVSKRFGVAHIDASCFVVSRWTSTRAKCVGRGNTTIRSRFERFTRAAGRVWPSGHADQYIVRRRSVPCLAASTKMSLTGFIQRPDGAPLGSEEDVMRQLSIFFPGMKFTYEAEEPPGSREAGRRYSLFLKLWMQSFGWGVPYPRHYGVVENPMVWVIEFHFVAKPVVPWVQTTSYGMPTGVDEIFERLRQATGWVTYYPP